MSNCTCSFANFYRKFLFFSRADSFFFSSFCLELPFFPTGFIFSVINVVKLPESDLDNVVLHI